MISFYISIALSIIASFFFAYFQFSFFRETVKHINLFCNFFNKNEVYQTNKCYDTSNGEFLQITQVGTPNSDLSQLIDEINHYIVKSKGTTDFSVIQNKVERKLNMRYEQSVARLAFPTYLGLMGTFFGVLCGITMFLIGFDDAGNISDTSIKNLLLGVLVSMGTSFFGLILTTRSNYISSNSKKQIEEDKNVFYDFIQTELMPSLDVSMVVAITKLHETVDNFEPAFQRVINSFQETFNRCTEAFGTNFETHVKAVANAVDIMGKNMDKININIDLQQRLLETLKSGDLVKGMDKYIEAANHFVGITQSLNKFEEARRMMLAAAQESISLQNQYGESLKIPREIAIRINQILDRITNFERAVNEAGTALTRRDILGNQVIETIEQQIKIIGRKDKIAGRYLEIADGKLEDLYQAQTKVITDMNNRYKQAIESHISGFESMLTRQTDELEKRHKDFMRAIEERFQVEDIRKEFTNLSKLNKLEEIEKRLIELKNSSIKAENLESELKRLLSLLNDIKGEMSKKEQRTTENEEEDGTKNSSFFGLRFGRNQHNN